ncbi:type VI secretion system baseplate subunit TssF [Pantoea endophytica]|uniref:type VI secretion system baseplate subunit TssF n=1 Tax=Pantoea endophytica TaxID=92488 RepID=UPI0030166975
MLNARFLALYNEELRYLRETGRQFAGQHPQVAEQLGIHEGGVQDPFVERLLEGTAFLSARVHQRIDNEYPEFALQMLSRLAPLWHTPTPAIATVAFSPDFTSPLWQAPVVLPAGSKVTLSDDSLKNKSASFTTGRTLQLEPLAITLAECISNVAATLPSAVSSLVGQAEACIRLRLTTHGVKALSKLHLDPFSLTFAGDDERANALLETLLKGCRQVVLWSGAKAAPVVATLPADALRLSGVRDEEALLPISVGELPGSRLMREYFAAPSRYYGVQLSGLRDFLTRSGTAHEFDMLFLLDSAPGSLLGRIDADDFQLFATPVINLATRRCDPVAIDNDRTEQQVIVDRLNPGRYEIHHLQSVQGVMKDGSSVQFSMLPMEAQFDRRHHSAAYALRHRELALPRQQEKSHFGQKGLFITLSPGLSGIDLADVTTLSVTAKVSDRHLRPEQLKKPSVQVETVIPARQTLLRMPSIPRPLPDADRAWQAIQMMSVNPLRYTRAEVSNCAQLIRHWLTLFAWPGDASQRRRIAGLDEAAFVPCFEHDTRPGPIAWNRGLKAHLNVQADHHADQGAFLFGHLLHYALTEYCQLNQTLRTTFSIDGETVAEWGPVDEQ